MCRINMLVFGLVWFPPVLGLAVHRCTGQESVAAPDIQLAKEYFEQADIMFQADQGALWGKSLAGPVIFVQPSSRMAVANQSDAEGKLVESDGVFVGTLPETLMVANTAVEWSGVHWTMVLWPLPIEDEERRVLLAHEAWHRIQNELGFQGSGAGNTHLDQRDGRYLVQLEWRALAVALESSGDARRQAIIDALAFRQLRHQQFENAASEEREMELHEGLAEYTGVRIALDSESRRRRTVQRLQTRPAQLKTFVRSFAYLSGPAYGILLDDCNTNWRKSIGPETSLSGLLVESMGIQADGDPESLLKRRREAYDGVALWVTEKNRAEEQQEKLDMFRARFRDGQRLELPLVNMNMSFNPNELIPIEGLGTVYPTITIADEWGVLNVTDGALITPDFGKVVVSTMNGYQGESESAGWTLDLSHDWFITEMADARVHALQKKQ